jgi:hypothetical protein
MLNPWYVLCVRLNIIGLILVCHSKRPGLSHAPQNFQNAVIIWNLVVCNAELVLGEAESHW